MPCNSNHMRASGYEHAMSQVFCLLDEIHTNNHEISKDSWRGYHPKVYNKALPKEAADKAIRKLCNACQNLERCSTIQHYSLELQTWWRDHKKRDAERLASERALAEKSKLQKQAIAKLTPEERKALGIGST